jgi:hypothetical protein
VATPIKDCHSRENGNLYLSNSIKKRQIEQALSIVTYLDIRFPCNFSEIE